MNQLEQVKPVELVLPPLVGPVPLSPPAAIAHSNSSLWIALAVMLILIGNACLVWWRIRGRDPLRRAFDAAAWRVGLNRMERKHLGEITPKGCPPVALLLSKSAMEKVIAGDEDPVVVSIRSKLEQVRN